MGSEEAVVVELSPVPRDGCSSPAAFEIDVLGLFGSDIWGLECSSCEKADPGEPSEPENEDEVLESPQPPGEVGVSSAKESVFQGLGPPLRDGSLEPEFSRVL